MWKGGADLSEQRQECQQKLLSSQSRDKETGRLGAGWEECKQLDNGGTVDWDCVWDWDWGRDVNMTSFTWHASLSVSCPMCHSLGSSTLPGGKMWRRRRKAAGGKGQEAEDEDIFFDEETGLRRDNRKEKDGRVSSLFRTTDLHTWEGCNVRSM